MVHHRTRPLLFAANRGTGAGPRNVVVFDTSTGKLLERIPVEVNPYALVLSDNGQTLYVTNCGSDSVSVIDTASLRVIGRIAGGAFSSCDLRALNKMKSALHGVLREGVAVGVLDQNTYSIIVGQKWTNRSR